MNSSAISVSLLGHGACPESCCCCIRTKVCLLDGVFAVGLAGGFVGGHRWAKRSLKYLCICRNVPAYCWEERLWVRNRWLPLARCAPRWARRTRIHTVSHETLGELYKPASYLMSYALKSLLLVLFIRHQAQFWLVGRVVLTSLTVTRG